MAGVNKEIWLSMLMKRFYFVGTFLQMAVDFSAFVEYNTLNLADCGVDPNVLINNNTFPIAIAPRTDSALALSLDTYDTENTVVRNIEKYELAYDKMGSVIEQHKNSLLETTLKKAAHAWAPSSDDTDTIIVQTTGDAASGELRPITLDDIAALQQEWDALAYPQEGRNLVLHPKHRSDLLKQDKTLFKQFANLKSGEVLPLFGFDISVFGKTAVYDGTNTKKAYGAASAGTDRHSSLAFLSSEVMKADGTYDMFVRYADPEQRGDIVGFQKRFLALPIRNKGIASIVSVPAP